MNSQDMISRLESKGIRPTANRILVMKTLMGEQNPQSLSNLERKMVSMDKSSIFRTLTLFLSHHLIHSIDDGTGSFKYAVCSDSCSCDVSDLHTHFHCEKCNKTFCFTNIPTPVVKLPQGFTLNSINYVLKGICPDCAAEANREA